MSTPRRTGGPARTATRPRRVDRIGQTKLNRAQLRAMEVRSAETLYDEPPTAETADESVAGDDTPGVAATVRRTQIVTRRRTVSRPVVLTKDQEYQFIRSDLQRLGLTAGPLFVLMVLLLLVVG